CRQGHKIGEGIAVEVREERLALVINGTGNRHGATRRECAGGTLEGEPERPVADGLSDVDTPVAVDVRRRDEGAPDWHGERGYRNGAASLRRDVVLDEEGGPAGGDDKIRVTGAVDVAGDQAPEVHEPARGCQGRRLIPGTELDEAVLLVRRILEGGDD